MSKSLLVFFTALTGCGEPTPWSSKPPETDLTRKHLERLSQEPQKTSFTVAIVADSQAVYGDFNKSMENINKRADVDFTLIAGDLTDRGLRKEFDFVVDVIQKAAKPVFTVVGNHDGLAYGKNLYKSTFGPLDYSFEYGGYKFIAWNNNGLEWNVNTQWLKQQINSHPKTIVFAHQPPEHASLNTDVAESWAELRKHKNLKASIHGHSHVYAFYKEGSLPVFTVDRVLGGAYGLMEVTPTKVTFHRCQSVCTEAVAQ
jgi:3',5'-cyclic-AMP phosphodiesterase